MVLTGECVEDNIRLEDTHGRVEICRGKQWRSVCSGDSWSANEAAVVCRQLGYPDLPENYSKNLILENQIKLI